MDGLDLVDREVCVPIGPESVRGRVIRINGPADRKQALVEVLLPWEDEVSTVRIPVAELEVVDAVTA